MKGTGLDVVIMPYFVFQFLQDKFGLSHLVLQACYDFMYNIEKMLEHFPQVEAFAFFMRELWEEDDLLFYLHLRNLLQSEFGISLKSKVCIIEYIYKTKYTHHTFNTI